MPIRTKFSPFRSQRSFTHPPPRVLRSRWQQGPARATTPLPLSHAFAAARCFHGERPPAWVGHLASVGVFMVFEGRRGWQPTSAHMRTTRCVDHAPARMTLGSLTDSRLPATGARASVARQNMHFLGPFANGLATQCERDRARCSEYRAHCSRKLTSTLAAAVGVLRANWRDVGCDAWAHTVERGWTSKVCMGGAIAGGRCGVRKTGREWRVRSRVAEGDGPSLLVGGCGGIRAGNATGALRGSLSRLRAGFCCTCSEIVYGQCTQCRCK